MRGARVVISGYRRRTQELAPDPCVMRSKGCEMFPGMKGTRVCVLQASLYKITICDDAGKPSHPRHKCNYTVQKCTSMMLAT
jgi:hypothetical protein